MPRESASDGNTLRPVDPRPGRTGTFVVLLLVWGIGCGTRLLELPAWSAPALSVDGGRLLATPDAYRWLAAGPGAIEVQARLLAVTSRLTGLPAADAAFWLPVLLAPILGVAVAGLALPLGRAAVLLAGGLAALAPGYFLRTRLGFFDHDMLTPALAVLLAWRLAHGLGWTAVRGGSDAPSSSDSGRVWFGWWSGGVLAGLALAWDRDLLGVLLPGLLAWTGCLVGLSERGPDRARRLRGLALTALGLGWGWTGAGLGLLVLAGLAWTGRVRRPGRAGPTDRAGRLAAIAHRLGRSGLCAGLVLALILGFGSAGALRAGSAKLGTWLGLESQVRADRQWFGGLDYRSVAPEVAENARLSGLETLRRLGPHPLAAVLGLAGFVWLAARRRDIRIILPLTALGLAAPWLGARLAMFAVPAVALGLAWGVSVAARLGVAASRGRLRPEVAVWAVALILLTVLTRPLLDFYAGLRPAPVLTASEVRVLRSAGQAAPTGATLWTWWDQGYAAAYYSGLPVWADGGRNDARRLFVLGRVLAASDPASALAMLRAWSLTHGRPWTLWEGRPSSGTARVIADMPDGRSASGESAPGRSRPVLIFVSWPMLKALPWMIRHAGPDFLADSRPLAPVGLLDAPYLVDAGRGELRLSPGSGTEQMTGGLPVRLSGLDSLGRDGNRSLDYPGAGPRLLLNRDLGEALLLTPDQARTLLVELLRAPSSEWRGFRLLADSGPSGRVWVWPGRPWDRH